MQPLGLSGDAIVGTAQTGLVGRVVQDPTPHETGI